MTLQFDTAGQENFRYGEAAVFEVPSPDGKFACVFEDDGETGYLYAVDTSAAEQKILDSMLIYAVDQVEDEEDDDEDPQLVIGWSVDGTACMMLINGYPQAVFDFGMKQGYCRSGFPPSSSKEWSGGGHEWNDDIMGIFLPKH